MGMLRLTLVLCLISMIVMGKSESVEEKDSEITPEETRELLIAALKIISKDRANRLRQQVAFKPSPVALNPAPVALNPVPVSLVSMSIPTEVASEKDDETSIETKGTQSANARRYLGVATNPYTGVLHYVNYPVYYPVYG